MIKSLSQSTKMQIVEDMSKLYEEVTQALSKLPSPCTSCGFCCHFDAAEHFLYVSTLEMIYLFDKYQLKSVPDTKICPFLKNNMCSVHDRRMLGCRTYFRLHSKPETIQAEQIYEQYLKKIRKLHQKYEISWNYQDCMNFFSEYERDVE